MAGGQRGDEFNSQMMRAVKPEEAREQAAAERIAKQTQDSWQQMLAKNLERTCDELRQYSRETVRALEEFRRLDGGRAVAGALRDIDRRVERIESASELNRSILFAINEVRDAVREVRDIHIQIQQTNAELVEGLNALTSTLMQAFGNGHSNH